MSTVYKNFLSPCLFAELQQCVIAPQTSAAALATCHRYLLPLCSAGKGELLEWQHTGEATG